MRQKRPNYIKLHPILIQKLPETKCTVESEIPNVHPLSYNAATQGWKNLRLKVKIAIAFSSQLATRESRRY